MEFRKIGEVTFDRLQVYPLDAKFTWGEDPNSVIVPSGAVCDVVSNGFTTILLLKGFLNTGRTFRIGDGAFTMQNCDEQSSVEVVVPSRSFGPDEWASVLTEDGIAWTFVAVDHG